MVSNHKKSFFRGWYLKHQAGSETISCIPSLHTDAYGNTTAFVQIITNQKSYLLTYKDFFIKKNSFYIRIGKNVFCTEGIFLDIPEIKCRGALCYGDFTPLRYNIMGPFSILKNMECNHGILSLRHSITGQLEINGKTISMNNGIGYIEKDWGTSFPSSYAWVQCNDFKEKAAVFVSAAKIPFCGSSFTGLIAVVYYKGKEYRFATYNGGKVLHCNARGFHIQRGSWDLVVNISAGTGHPLQAPVFGEMSRTIYERTSCSANFIFSCHGNIIFNLHSNNASFEYAPAKSNL